MALETRCFETRRIGLAQRARAARYRRRTSTPALLRTLLRLGLPQTWPPHANRRERGSRQCPPLQCESRQQCWGRTGNTAGDPWHSTSPSTSPTSCSRLITLDYVLRKGTQSNWSGKQARICVLCDAFCPTHSAATSQRRAPAPRQRCIFLKTNSHSGNARPAHEHATSGHRR